MMLTLLFCVFLQQSPPPWAQTFQKSLFAETPAFTILHLAPANQEGNVHQLKKVADGFHLAFHLRLYDKSPENQPTVVGVLKSWSPVMDQEERPSSSVNAISNEVLENTSTESIDLADENGSLFKTMPEWTDPSTPDQHMSEDFLGSIQIIGFNTIQELLSALDKGSILGWVLPFGLDEQASLMNSKKTEQLWASSQGTSWWAAEETLSGEAPILTELTLLLTVIDQFQNQPAVRKRVLSNLVGNLQLKKTPARKVLEQWTAAQFISTGAFISEQNDPSRDVDMRWHSLARRKVQPVDPRLLHFNVK